MLLKTQTFRTNGKTGNAHNKVFFCPEESQFYAQCIEKMVLNQCLSNEEVIEFGAGDGSPVISSLLKSSFNGSIKGYELSPAACKLAQAAIVRYKLNKHYVVYNQSFFEGVKDSKAAYLIANPPYLPAVDNDILMPSLHGGIDGATITKQLLSLGNPNVMSLISAYSNPRETIEYALEQGYDVVDFMISPLPFGYYSSEAKVRQRIDQLHQEGKAFFSHNVYFLAGVLFRQRSSFNKDLSSELIKVMTAL